MFLETRLKCSFNLLIGYLGKNCHPSTHGSLLTEISVALKVEILSPVESHLHFRVAIFLVFPLKIEFIPSHKVLYPISPIHCSHFVSWTRMWFLANDGFAFHFAFEGPHLTISSGNLLSFPMWVEDIDGNN